MGQSDVLKDLLAYCFSKRMADSAGGVGALPRVRSGGQELASGFHNHVTSTTRRSNSLGGDKGSDCQRAARTSISTTGYSVVQYLLLFLHHSLYYVMVLELFITLTTHACALFSIAHSQHSSGQGTLCGSVEQDLR